MLVINKNIFIYIYIYVTTMCFKENYCVIQQGYFISLFVCLLFVFFSYHQGYVDLNGTGIDNEFFI